jgi:hypothetical protein
MSDKDVYADDAWGVMLDDDDEEQAERDTGNVDESDMLAGNVPEAVAAPVEETDDDVVEEPAPGDREEPEAPGSPVEGAPAADGGQARVDDPDNWDLPTPMSYKERIERLQAAAAKQFNHVVHEVNDDVLHIRIPCEIRLWLEAQVKIKEEAGMRTTMSQEIRLAIRLLQFASLQLWQIEEVMRAIGLLPAQEDLGAGEE